VRVLAVVHQPDAGSGVFAEAVAGQGHELVELAKTVRDEPGR
jgi:hypothetical protein